MNRIYFSKRPAGWQPCDLSPYLLFAARTTIFHGMHLEKFGDNVYKSLNKADIVGLKIRHGADDMGRGSLSAIIYPAQVAGTCMGLHSLLLLIRDQREP
jgi:hypothetical protein